MAFILDVDTGSDDALALLLALRLTDMEILGITCVAGNQRLPRVVENTGKILDLLDISLPLLAGADRPLLTHLRPPDPLHGLDGMADLDLPDSTRPIAEEHAVHFLGRTLTAAVAPIDLICLAPLTNIALFLRTYPHLASKLGTVWIMGGTFAAPGNVTAAAEFNVRHDPEAAAIVLQSGLDIRLYSLDVFRQVDFDRREIDRLCASPDPCPRTAGRILRYSTDYFDTDRALIGDAGTVAIVARPDLATFERHPIQVVLSGEARGMTLVDRRTAATRARENHWWEPTQTEVEIVTAVDVEGVRGLFWRSIGGDASLF